VLDYFAAHTDFNLLFAPHVMLFKRRVHMTVEGMTMKWRRNLAEKYRQFPNIIIDTGSAASLDMTYTLAADIYLGDVSSQIYEFLIEPRPCIFLNAHNQTWENDPNYAFWHFGKVVRDISGLDAALKSARADHAIYRPLQEKAFKETFDIQPTPAAARAADAIAAFLKP
jgi:hypothetical protein